MRLRSIQTQLILSMGAALLISLLIVLGLYAVLVNRLSERYLLQQALPASIQAIANDFERRLTGPITAASGIAENTLVQDWLAAGENPAQLEEFTRYLAGIRSSQKAFAALIASNASGAYYSDKGKERVLSRSDPKDNWYFQFIDSGEPRMWNIDVDGSTGELALFIDQRVERNGRLLGIAGLGLEMRELSTLIRDFRFGKSGRVYLVKNDGQVQIHPDPAHVKDRTLADLVGVQAAGELLGKHEFHSARFQRDGENLLAASLPLHDLGWTLVSEVPEAEIYADARDALAVSGVAGAGVALLCLALVVLMARSLVKPIRQVTGALLEIGGGGGDLTRRLDDSRTDELGDLSRGFNRFLEGQRALIGAVLATSQQLLRTVSEVAQVVENTAERAGRQQEMTDMVATAVNEMGSTVQEIARNAEQAASASQQARDEAGEARRVVEGSLQVGQRMSGEIGDAAGAVSELAEQVASIDQVLAVIRGISEQTNLLALNAAIEAARAGELGRGFAVVADEVRTLASRTQGSTDEILAIIQRLKDGADAAVRSMHSGQQTTGQSLAASEQAGVSLGAIADQVERISDINHQVATATEEQSAVTEEINRNVQGISDLAHATTREVQHGREQCRELRGLADDLARQMAQFRL
ncbi:methyl-accepting chemotaxis protein [Pseudomonas sp. ZM23]|uniref:Methyl-accepting chemotaxis protein n=2 Tax=Pseudomonas triclosanedens TaxID=2961893 RepID=A0ABY6ZYE1_9PSED|nr:methyl-accepting chemotaxis protein [Pseudomonas triclosanedens]MCP8462655.1 methyl-accepting chemotaxis protein [Pseudomonas triclosanedens]MCP8468274.1 methyl-accepting chemotaxis protein [Pseudomonas triclosanedens]MCP8475033.1 methyl-accepting chemotaxis protein [Pseudomonas triclosanedens]WAI49843.1 methyl-accepting chemotaxis protein [Pseudomonas triclosanedens]